MSTHVSTGFPISNRAKERLARLKRRRKLWLQVHLYLGLLAGLVLVVIGITGSILVFWHEIDIALNPELYQIETPPAGQRTIKPFSELIAAAQSAMPIGAKLLNIAYSDEPGLAFTFSFSPAQTIEGEYETLNAFIDPYTAKVTGTRIFYSAANPFDNCFVGLLLKLHYNLLLGDTPGMAIVGILAVLLLISVLTGLILWWPLTGKWRQAFTIKRRASIERFNFDLHKTMGIYTAAVLLAVLFSGIYFNLNEQFMWLVERFSPVTDIWNLSSKHQPSSTQITPDQALGIAMQYFPEGQLKDIGVPQNDAGAYRVCWKHVPSLQRYVIDTRCIAIDQYSGDIVVIYDPVNGTAGDVFVQWQWPLHSGHAFGWTGRILVLLSGLSCPVLFITGVIRWQQKRRSARLRSERGNTKYSAEQATRDSTVIEAKSQER